MYFSRVKCKDKIEEEKKFRLPNARYVKLDNYVYFLNDIMYSVCFAMPTESENKVFFWFFSFLFRSGHE